MKISRGTILPADDSRLIRRIRMPVGTLLYKEGTLICSAYLLETGTIGISRRDQRGVDRIATVLCAGDMVGLDDIFRGDHYTSRAVVLQEAVLQAFPSNLFVEVLSSDSHAAVHLLSTLSSRLARSEFHSMR